MLNLLYHEAKFNVIEGRYVVQPEEYDQLAGIQALIHLEHYNPSTHTQEHYKYVNIQLYNTKEHYKYINIQLYNTQKHNKYVNIQLYNTQEHYKYINIQLYNT